jgi:cardiolipin synthase
MRAMHAGSPWRDGNRVRLLENGEQFFERAFQAISAARREILLETFILFEDRVGTELHRLLVEAARRGVRVEVTVDGYGSPRFSPGFLASLAQAGVRFRVFDPHRTLFGMRLHVFRRLHRKLLVVDAERAFVGGINYSADHLGDFGPKSKQDYAIELEGPVVADVHDFATAAIAGHAESWQHRVAAGASDGNSGGATVLFDIRDNGARSNNIEHHYRSAIRGAQREIIIANAYFFPGYGFLSELRHAAQRGVRVSLIVQGEPDTPLAASTRILYRELVMTGVDIHEYCERPFHGKVALIDDEWATVGSSNLDPLSLSLNLEANVFVRDRDFNQDLRRRLLDLRRRHCRRVDIDHLPQHDVWRRASQPLLYHVLRHFPAWAGLLPAHTPKVVLLAPHADDKA